jgi:hypothetical protein
MRFEVIDNHSVAVDLLGNDYGKESDKGWVLDAGARGFKFAADIYARFFKRIITLDPSAYGTGRGSSSDGGPVEWCCDLQAALVCRRLRPKQLYLIKTDDPSADYVSDEYKQPCTYIQSHTITELMEMFGIKQFDLVKLNIEGAEFEILDEWPGSIARQIVVSLHEHTQARRGRAECDRLIAKMGQWYNVFNVVWEKKYGCSENYWDLVFILKELC